MAVGVWEGQDDDVDDGGEEAAHALPAAHVPDVLFGEVREVGHHTALKDGVKDVHEGDGSKVDGEEFLLPRVGVDEGEASDAPEHHNLAELKLYADCDCAYSF